MAAAEGGDDDRSIEDEAHESRVSYLWGRLR